MVFLIFLYCFNAKILYFDTVTSDLWKTSYYPSYVERFSEQNMIVYLQLYSRSTDLDRTLMSAEALLSAVFPPSGEQIWNEDIKWQPIPVHTEPRQDDTVIIYTILNSVSVAIS